MELLPNLLQKPLLKTSNGPIEGVQSGRRSAVIKVDGKFYRLKGCGDLYEGFPLAEVNHPSFSECQQVRGCMFDHTSSRALYLTELVSEVMQNNNIVTANIPIGWWRYDVEEPLPKIGRTCGVFETFGNKRLGDNVLLGLERMLPFIFQDQPFDILKDSFGEGRVDGDAPFPTYIASLIGLPEVDAHNINLKEKVPRKFEGIDSEWSDIWDESIMILEHFYMNEKKKHPVGSLLAHLYWRLGREIGTIVRIMSEANISWGTYVDPLGTHCNAHINNLVILPQGEPGSKLLSLLDFDMAFTKTSFTEGEDQWNEWHVLEINGMLLCLAGDPELNSGVETEAQLSQDVSMIKWLLRDTMVLGFRSGLDGTEDIHPPIPELDDAVHSLLKMAMIITDTETA
eukprot:TRINITY_DN959_c0_g1_i2.p1 TRINITY_DN959_c0_g1~~TRINITY_DN959_c0_g1_i2.p1  ORF type:complete len:398 (-),score=117.31 TRINITY_DN959_c0_g1_i2:67-1260(-)